MVYGLGFFFFGNLFGFEGVFDFVDDFGLDNDVGKGVDLGYLVVVNQLGEYGYVSWMVSFIWVVQFIWMGGNVQFGEEVGKGWYERELVGLMGGCLGQFVYVIVWVYDVYVLCVQWWDGDGLVLKDEVLGEFVNLCW